MLWSVLMPRGRLKQQSCRRPENQESDRTAHAYDSSTGEARTGENKFEASLYRAC